jgi:hypothetical protein
VGVAGGKESRQLGWRWTREIASAPTTGTGKALLLLLLLPLPELSRMAWGNASIYSEAWEVEREGAWPGLVGPTLLGAAWAHLWC